MLTKLQAWWRAVGGGKKAAHFLRSRGCDTVGRLYKHVVAAAAAASKPSTITTPNPANSTAFTCMPPVETLASGNAANGGRSVGEIRVAGEPGGDWRQLAREGVAGSKLHRLVRDDDLAMKISTLLLRLMFAFEDLRVSDRFELKPCYVEFIRAS